MEPPSPPAAATDRCPVPPRPAPPTCPGGMALEKSGLPAPLSRPNSVNCETQSTSYPRCVHMAHGHRGVCGVGQRWARRPSRLDASPHAPCMWSQRLRHTRAPPRAPAPPTRPRACSHQPEATGGCPGFSGRCRRQGGAEGARCAVGAGAAWPAGCRSLRRIPLCPALQPCICNPHVCSVLVFVRVSQPHQAQQPRPDAAHHLTIHLHDGAHMRVCAHSGGRAERCWSHPCDGCAGAPGACCQRRSCGRNRAGTHLH